MRVTRDQRLVLAIAILASFVSFLDGTVVNVALPAIDRELGGGLATQQWVVDGYLITLGSLILVAGSVSDAYGRVLVLRVGLVSFGITSLVCAVAPTPEILVAGRLLQGGAGALLVPSSLAFITSNFRDAAQTRAIGIWTAATTGAMVAGPVLGGAFVDLLSWRLVFLINVIPIAATLVLLHRLGQVDHREEGARVHGLDAILCAVGLGAFVFGLIEQPRLGWEEPLVLVALVGGVAAFATFLVRQNLVASPMLPLSLFRVRNFWTGNLATFFIYGALSLNGFVVGIYLQQGAGLPATLAGLASLPTTVIMIALSSRVGSLAGRWGPRLFMTIGPIVMAVGALLLLLVRSDFDYGMQVLPGIIVFGLGLTLTVAPLTSAILGSIGTERSGIASALNNAVSRVAGLLAIALVGVLVGSRLDLPAFHRGMVVTATMLAAGGIVSFLGIRNRSRTDTAAIQGYGDAAAGDGSGTAHS